MTLAERQACSGNSCQGCDRAPSVTFLATFTTPFTLADDMIEVGPAKSTSHPHPARDGEERSGGWGEQERVQGRLWESHD